MLKLIVMRQNHLLLPEPCSRIANIIFCLRFVLVISNSKILVRNLIKIFFIIYFNLSVDRDHKYRILTNTTMTIAYINKTEL